MNAMAGIKVGACFAVSLVLLADPVGGQAPPAETVSPARLGLEDLRFMSGCWRGSFPTESGAGTIEEHYTEPARNVMLGTTRYLVDGVATQFELTAIQKEGESVVLTPYPGGVRSEHGFRLTAAGQNRAVFEAPEHDYPKRVVYRREGTSLVARIDAGAKDPEGREWRMTPAPCAERAS